MRRKAAGKLLLSYEEKMKLMGSFSENLSDSIKKKALDIVVSECEHDATRNWYNIIILYVCTMKT